MYVYGGYIGEEGRNMKDIWAFDFESEKWELIFDENTKQDQPEGRSSFSMTSHNGKLIIFGGTNGEKTLNDFWSFDLHAKQWKKIDSKDTPDVLSTRYSPVEATL